jgi:hypothetical protein
MITLMLREIGKRLWVASVGKLVEVNDGSFLLFDEKPYEVGTNEAGSSGDENFHGLIFN